MTKDATIDLASLSAGAACDAGYELELLHPVTKAPLDVFIEVVGSESEVFQAQVRKRTNERLKRQFETTRKGREEAPTVEQAEKDTIELLASCIKGWRTGDKPTVTHGGKPLDFNATNAQFLLKERWIRAQVDEAVGDLGNFIKD